MTFDKTVLIWIAAKMRNGMDVDQAINATLAEIKTMLMDGGLYEELRAKGASLLNP